MAPPSRASSGDPDHVDDSQLVPTHKWNHFEVRTLICLIIKGEHLTTNDPMHIADKLNMALNTSSARNKPDYDRDIPHDDVQYMLKRILAKKMHAVNVSDRDSRPTVTRTKLNAFMRSLDFDGSGVEWVTGRKEVVRMESEKRRARYIARKERAELSLRAREERHRRKMMVREPRARRLLHGWGIGASFWEGESKSAYQPGTRSKSRDSSSSGASYTPASNGTISYITDRSSAPSTGNDPPVYAARRDGATHPSNPTAMTPNPAVATWGGQFAPALFTPLSTCIMPAQVTSSSRYGYGGAAGFHDGLQQPHQSTGWNMDDTWGSLPDMGVDRQHR